MHPTLLIFIVLSLTVYGQLMLKARALAHALPADGSSSKLSYLFAMFSDLGVLSSLFAALLAAVFWMLAVERLPVTFAYPFMALSFVAVPIGSKILFGESLQFFQLLGLGLIVIGVAFSAICHGP